MVIFKPLEKPIHSVSDKDVFLFDLHELMIKMHLLLSQKGVPEKVSKNILLNVTKHQEKKSFIEESAASLKETYLSEFEVKVIIDELKWLIRKENFRWKFEAFHLYQVKTEDMLHIS